MTGDADAAAGGTRAARRQPPAPIPLTVLTGFLGAGKTTLLNALLQDPALSGTAVIINEFGEIGLDHLLVRKIDDNVMLLQSGCLCCTMRGDLIDALENLLRDLDNGRAAFHRVVLETTGLADPAPVLQSLMTHPYLVMRFRLDGVVTLVDAANGDATLDMHLEAVKQAAMADRLVLTKTDLAAPEQTAAIRGRLRALNPAAPIVDAARGEATPSALLNCGLYNPESKIVDVGGWLNDEAHAAAKAHGHDHDDHGHVEHGHAEHSHVEHGHAGHHHAGHHHHDINRHDDRIRAFVLATHAPIAETAFQIFLDLLRSLHGPNLLRVKGIVKIAERPDKPLVLHAVQHILHPFATLDRWPDGDTRTRLVFITRDLPEATVNDLFQAILGTPAPDRPDRKALADNPLVPFGGIDR